MRIHCDTAWSWQALCARSVPTVSARNAMYHLIMNKAHGFAEEDVHCGVHPNPLGHRRGPADVPSDPLASEYSTRTPGRHANAAEQLTAEDAERI